MLDDLGWDICHVVGNSLRGWRAFELARRATCRCCGTPCAPAPACTGLEGIECPVHLVLCRCDRVVPERFYARLFLDGFLDGLDRPAPAQRDAG